MQALTIEGIPLDFEGCRVRVKLRDAVRDAFAPTNFHSFTVGRDYDIEILGKDGEPIVLPVLIRGICIRLDGSEPVSVDLTFAESLP